MTTPNSEEVLANNSQENQEIPKETPKETPLEIFIIHYKKLTERKKYLDNALRSEGFSDIHWFEDIDRSTMTQEQLDMYEYNSDKWYELNATWKQFQSKPRLLTKPEIACAVTHILIYKYIVENNIPRAIVFEDDCILKPDFNKNVQTVLRELPDDFDICYMNDAFGWNVSNYRSNIAGYLGSLNKNVVTPDKHVYPMRSSKCGDSFILSHKGASLLYKNLSKFYLPIDWMHTPIFFKNNMSVYWADPALTHQGSEDVYASSVGRDNVVHDEPEERNPERLPSDIIEKYSMIKGEFNDTRYASLEKEASARLEELTYRLLTGNNFTCIRFGDGEIRNMISDNEREHNCDGCFYYKQLGLDLIQAYIYFLRSNTSYIHSWHSHTYHLIEKIQEDYAGSFNPERKFLFFDILNHKLPFRKETVDFYKAIKHSNRTKIYISNIDMIKALAPLLGINYGICIPTVNSYLEKDRILANVDKTLAEIKQTSDIIFLVSGGMFGKVLMHEMSMKYPKNTFLDIGSSFDGLIKHSRDFNGTREYQEALLKTYS